MHPLPEPIHSNITAQVASFTENASAELRTVMATPEVNASLPLVWASSEFVMNTCLRDASFLPTLVNTDALLHAVDASRLRAMLDQELKDATSDADLQSALRRFRRRYMARIAWRDIAGWATLNETLLELSNLADICVQATYQHTYATLSALYGTPIGHESGQPQH